MKAKNGPIGRTLAVGLAEGRPSVRFRLRGSFRDETGKTHPPGEYAVSHPVALIPNDPEKGTFELADFTIGIGFHWERRRSSAFQGDLRIVRSPGGLTVINDVPLETYVASVIGSEMSASSPVELLRAHAVISRSWLVSQVTRDDGGGTFRKVDEIAPGEWRIQAWYGREGHAFFDVCADDHCQRYQGMPPQGSERAVRAAAETAGRFLVYGEEICDARFSKCCGGITEDYAAAWEERPVPYLVSVFDGEGPLPEIDDARMDARMHAWLTDASAAVYCNASDPDLLTRVLPGFDLETRDFFRWRVETPRDELSDRVREKSGVDVGRIERLVPIRRGRSGRIVELQVRGTKGLLNVGKELEIRRILSPSHLYSSAFVVGERGGSLVFEGAGWGHGVGLCQIGAAVLADRGWPYSRILAHYYPGTRIQSLVRSL